MNPKCPQCAASNPYITINGSYRIGQTIDVSTECSSYDATCGIQCANCGHQFTENDLEVTYDPGKAQRGRDIVDQVATSQHGAANLIISRMAELLHYAAMLGIPMAEELTDSARNRFEADLYSLNGGPELMSAHRYTIIYARCDGLEAFMVRRDVSTKRDPKSYLKRWLQLSHLGHFNEEGCLIDGDIIDDAHIYPKLPEAIAFA